LYIILRYILLLYSLIVIKKINIYFLLKKLKIKLIKLFMITATILCVLQIELRLDLLLLTLRWQNHVHMTC
ncbi:MAG: hypothetical protein N7Q72_06890, partial [Spiroplasma sp. Tabriz.8]|nr:hypothetical protein [Spiroplasma sp. Tabriz.8]